MSINFTLIVQAGNFFAAYLILRFFLFKPAVAEIDKEKKNENDLLSQIDQHALTNNLLAQENQDQWRMYQLNFAQETPQIISSDLCVLRNIAPMLTAPEQDQALLEATEQKIIETIVNKVSDVQT